MKGETYNNVIIIGEKRGCIYRYKYEEESDSEDLTRRRSGSSFSDAPKQLLANSFLVLFYYFSFLTLIFISCVINIYYRSMCWMSWMQETILRMITLTKSIWIWFYLTKSKLRFVIFILVIFGEESFNSLLLFFFLVPSIKWSYVYIVWLCRKRDWANRPGFSRK